jgi:cell pole-organizing protein PopZ
MPRSLLLSLAAAFTLAACAQQADTGAAPAPETAEAPEAQALPADTAAVVDDTTAVIEDTTAPVEETGIEEPTVEETVPAEDTVPVEEPAADETMDETWPSDSTSADSTGY